MSFKNLTVHITTVTTIPGHLLLLILRVHTKTRRAIWSTKDAKRTARNMTEQRRNTTVTKKGHYKFEHAEKTRQEPHNDEIRADNLSLRKCQKYISFLAILLKL